MINPNLKPSANAEQHEAYQQDVNADRETFVESLDEENQRKFKAVEQAVKILVDNKILFFLYPCLTNNMYNEDIFWQWNSIFELMHDDKKSAQELSREIYELNLKFLGSVYQNTMKYSPFGDLPIDEQFVMFGRLTRTALEKMYNISKKEE